MKTMCLQNPSQRRFTSAPQEPSQWKALVAKSLGWSAVAVSVAGCAGNPNRLALATVGPSPACPPAVISQRGSLVVYSECAANISESLPYASDSLPVDGTTISWDYSGYQLLSADGKYIRYVSNHDGNNVPHPQQLELPAGKYIVAASASDYGRIHVPVVINGSQVTVVHLDREGYWPAEAAFNETNAVYLPNGKAIGWRAF